MDTKFNCKGVAEVQFSRTEIGTKDSGTLNDEKTIKKFFEQGIKQTLEEEGLTIQEVKISDFNYTFTEVQ